MRLKAEWAIDSVAMRVRGIIVLVKSNCVCVYIGNSNSRFQPLLAMYTEAS